jgi:hypothetical protein
MLNDKKLRILVPKYSQNSNTRVPFTNFKILPPNIRKPVSSREHNATGTVRDFIHELGLLTPVTLTPLWDNRSPLVTVLQNT